MALFEEQVGAVKTAFRRLSPREQATVLGGAGAAFLTIMLGVGLMVSSAISKAEHRVTVKTGQLLEVLELQGAYKAREQAQEERKRKLRGRNRVRLVKMVEDAARNSGVEIGQLRPEDGEPNEEGIYESRVELRASKLSIDRLQDFLSRLESSPGTVVIRRLKLNKPYRKDTLDVDIEVTTYRVKS